MPDVEFILLANHAETKDGLLYLLGGGWTDHSRNVPPGSPPPVSHFAVAGSVLVPWDDTNQRHQLTLKIETEDGAEVGGLAGELEVGRPPGLPAGADQRWVFALNFDMVFPRIGGYRVVAELRGQRKTVSFRVHDRSLAAPPR